ncbi:MAG: hypothetical protein ABIK07_08625, partial [Planctomycetota bacterium]
IIARTEALLTRIDEVETTTGSLEMWQTQLDQSILAKAFRGELVPQDPNDEPASVLLERICEQRNAQVAAKKNGKVTTRLRTRKKEKS